MDGQGPAREGGDGGTPPREPTRAELALTARALRNDWPISPAAKRQLLQRLVNVAVKSRHERNRISAAKCVALYMKLNALQAAQDLAERKYSGGDDGFTLADLVAEAEASALGHKPAERPK